MIGRFASETTATVFEVKRVPRATVPQDGVEESEELPQGGDEGDLLGVAGRAEALVDGGERGIIASGREGRHVQDMPHGAPTPRIIRRGPIAAPVRCRAPRGWSESC